MLSVVKLLLMSLKNCSVITTQSFVALSFVVKTLSLKSHYWRRVLKKNVRGKLAVTTDNKVEIRLKVRVHGPLPVLNVVASSDALQVRALRTSTATISSL